MLAMWGAGILAARERMRNEPALESGGQDESSSAGGVIMAVEEDDDFAHLFADPTIYAPSPAVTVAPVPVPVLLAGAEAPLPFTGPKKVLRPQFRDLQRPLVQSSQTPAAWTTIATRKDWPGWQAWHACLTRWRSAHRGLCGGCAAGRRCSA